MASAGYPDSYYAATALPTPTRPRLAGEAGCDVAVIGGGYTGLSAALHLAERGYSVVLLEAQRLAWGASGRNGGQLNSGLRMGACDLTARFGRDGARRLWDMAEEAKALVRARIQRHEIACDYKPGTLFAAHKPRDLDWMAAEVEALQRQFGYPSARLVSRDEAAAMVASKNYHGGIHDADAGHLHPLNYAIGLARAAEAAGARLFEGSTVLTIDGDPAPTLRTAVGDLKARQVVLACNGYLGRLEPRIARKIMPISNYILATEPLGEERARALIRDDVAVHDSKFVVDYYRLSADRRLLFGGGETYFGEPPDLKAFVRRYMLRVFPQLAAARIDYAWAGQLAITMNRLPHFGRLDGSIYFAHGYSGQGVALATLAGRLIAEAVAGSAERFDVFARIPHRDLPGGLLFRKPLLALALMYYGLRDRL